MASPLLDLGPFLSLERVVFLNGSPSKRDALLYLAEVTAAQFATKDRAAFVKAIFEREDVTSTAIGFGVAIPHARLPSLPGCVIGVAICAQGVDFAARDNQRVHIMTMIAARDRDRSEHLRVLASVASRLQDPARRGRLLSAPDAATVLAVLRE